MAQKYYDEIALPKLVRSCFYVTEDHEILWIVLQEDLIIICCY